MKKIFALFVAALTLWSCDKNFEEIIFLIKERIIEDFNGLNYIAIIDNMFPKQTKSDEISLMYYKYLLSLTNRLNGLIMKTK
jgi:hypothetical protein